MTDHASGLLFVGCSLVVAAALVLAAKSSSWAGHRLAGGAIIATGMATILLVVGTLYVSSQRLGDVRLSLRSISFRFDQERAGSPVTVGGDRRDHIVVAGRLATDARMPPGALRLRRLPQGTPAIGIEAGAAGADARAGVVFARPEADTFTSRARDRLFPRPWSAIGAVPFDGSVTLCVPATAGFDAVRLAPDGSRLVLNGTPAAFPLPERWGTPAVVHDYAAVRSGPGRVRAPASRSLVLRGDNGLSLVVLDQGAFATHGSCGGRSEPLRSAALTLAPGSTLHLSFRALAAAEPWEVAAALESEKPEAPRSRLVDLRSASLSLTATEDGAAALTVVFDTPESLRIAASDISDGATKDLMIALGGTEDRASGLDLAATRFRTTGAPLAEGFVQRLKLSPTSADLVGNRQVQPIDEGEPFILGTRDKATVKLERLDFGWAPMAGAAWLAVAGLLLGIGGSWHWRRVSSYAFIILAIVDFLLGVRLLAGIEAAIIDPNGPGTAASISLSLLALAAAPWLLGGFAPREVKEAVPRWQVAAYAGLTVPLIAHLWLFNGLHAVPLAILGAALAVAAGVALRPQWGTCIGRFALSGGQRVGCGLARLTRWNTDAPPPLFSGAVRRMAAASALLAVRLVLPERPFGFSIAAVYTPLWILYAAFGLHAAARAAAAEEVAERPSRGLWCVWLVLLPMPLAWPLLSPFGADPGFAIVNAAALIPVMLLLTLWMPARAGPRRWLPTVPLAAAVLALLIAGSGSLLTPDWPSPRDSSRSAENKRLQIIESSLQAERSTRRLLAWFAPARLADRGTREDEELTVALHQMRQYGSQGLFGRGYLNQPQPTELRLFQLNDNVSAIHLLAPFGRAGAVAFLLVLACGAVGITWRRISRATGPPTYGHAIAYVSLWSVLVGSLYMILANLLILPFTGRNVYLLAASSTSDLVEGLALFAAALAGLTWKGETS